MHTYRISRNPINKCVQVSNHLRRRISNDLTYGYFDICSIAYSHWNDKVINIVCQDWLHECSCQAMNEKIKKKTDEKRTTTTEKKKVEKHFLLWGHQESLSLRNYER